MPGTGISQHEKNNTKERNQSVSAIPLINQGIYCSKTCLKRALKKKTKIGFQDRLSLNAGQQYCRMHQESILQYVRPSLSYHLSLRPLFCQFLSGRFKRVLLYIYFRFLSLYMTVLRASTLTDQGITLY